MTRQKDPACHLAAAGLLAMLLPSSALAQEPKIIQPGAPGEPNREITVEEATNLAAIRFTDADVKFMQGMISHHAQALEMTELLETRTQSEEMRLLAKRIELSQEDEIGMMQNWLRENGQDVTGAHDHHGHGAEMMPGMLTSEQMAQLEAASGMEFDRLFLDFMIQHHDGALVMVDELLDSEGAAQEPTIFAFTSEIVADQSAEISRMADMLSGLSDDPRAGLAAGFLDADVAIWNMELVAALPKPPGFFDPENPAGLPVPPERKEDEEEEEGVTGSAEEAANRSGAGEANAEGSEAASGESSRDEGESRRRTPLLDFANSDMAFSNDLVIEGSYHGFNTYSVEDPTEPRLLASVVCPGGQGDVSVVGDLLIMSAQETRGRLDCGLQGVAEKVSEERFRGVRVFDISDVTSPVQVAAVQTCRGSHTHSVMTDPDDEGNVYVINSGTSQPRPGEELDGCSGESPGDDPNTSLFSIDIIQDSGRQPVRSPYRQLAARLR